MKLAIINRGVVGSGKSTFAKALKDGCLKNNLTCSVHNSDEYFMVDGEYKFDFTKLGYYHRLNLNAFIESMKEGVNVVVADNTNTTPKEYKKYLNEARKAGYLVFSVVFIPDKHEVHFERNTHNVPKETIEKMIHRLNDNLETLDVDYSVKFKPNAPYQKFEERINMLVREVLYNGGVQSGLAENPDFVI